MEAHSKVWLNRLVHESDVKNCHVLAKIQTALRVQVAIRKWRPTIEILSARQSAVGHELDDADS